MKRIYALPLWLLCVALLSCCSDSSNAPPKPTFYAQTIAAAKAFIESQMSEKEIVGLSIALVDAERGDLGSVVWSQGFGMADKEKEKKASAETLYSIGSVGKAMTGVAVLKLKDEGKIDLDMPASTYIPEFSLQVRYPGIGQNDRITVRSLLTMHGGVPGDLYNGGTIITLPWYNKYMTWLLAYLRTDYPLHPPGALGSYSNTGFVVAGHAAYLAGRSEGDTDFQGLLKRLLLDPLGMDESRFTVFGEDLPQLAVPYEQGFPQIPTNYNIPATNGVYSNVTDMSKFLLMLLKDGVSGSGNRYLQAETVREMGHMNRTALDTSSFVQYGLGLDSASLPAFYGVAPDQGAYGRAWAKNGSTGPYNAQIMLLPNTNLKLGVVVLSNSDTARSAVTAIARQCLLEAVKEKLGLSENPEPKPLPDFSAEAITGVDEIKGLYGTNSPIGYYRIETRDGNLFWATQPFYDPNEGNILTLKPDGSNAFSVEEENWDVVFVDRTDIYGTEYRLLIQIGGMEEILGPNSVITRAQKMPPPDELPEEWQQRIDKTYVADQMIVIAFDPYLKFPYKDGLLLAQTPDKLHVIYPQNADLAFVGDTMSKGDGAITVSYPDGNERLHYLLSEYFSVDQIEEYTLEEQASFEIELREDLPLTIWRKITVSPESPFAGQKVRFVVSPGHTTDFYNLFDENLEAEGMEFGTQGADFTLQAGVYYLAVNLAVESTGTAYLNSEVVP
jgi:CubicO group peptidase (beta-lactamase class C family)